MKSHPLVTDAVIVGVPEPRFGEQVAAIVAPASPRLDLEGLQEHCRAVLASYKCPRTIDFTDAMPRDPNGKLYKRRLRDPYWDGRERAV